MPILKEVHSNDNHLVIWHIVESEEQLLAELSQPVNLPASPAKRLERLAALVLLKRIGYGEKYCYHPDGRPYLPDNSDFISISHAGNKVVIAINSMRPVGVDIEHTARNYRRIASKFLNQREMNYSLSSGPTEMALFWTFKEAVYKLPWGVSKKISEDIDVLMDGATTPGGWCNIRVKHNGEWVYLNGYFEYFDDFCLAWVNL